MNTPFFDIDQRLQAAADKATEFAAGDFARIEEITEYNQLRVLSAFIKNGVSESHFQASTGYGYNDRGRETLDRVFADSVGAEDAIVRHSFASGTHALCVALFGVLRPGDAVLCATGSPYDTIWEVMGLRGGGMGSLKDFGINYRQTELLPDGSPDTDAIAGAVSEGVRLVYIQRSRGYSLRPSLSVSGIEKIAAAAKKANPGVIVMVDNCYGEFAERDEPVSRGADLMAGSLIKNPGGGIAPSGGYIAGRAELVELCAYRHTAPGPGREIGATLGHGRELYMGLFSAPHVTGEAMKAAAFAAAFFELLGFEVTPKAGEPRYDIIETVRLGSAGALTAFCRGIQKGSPVDSFVAPEPWDMPGYDAKVIMAAGAFTLGASIELSADAPLREPFAVWMQGGLNFHSAKAGIMLGAQSMLREGFIRL